MGRKRAVPCAGRHAMRRTRCRGTSRRSCRGWAARSRRVSRSLTSSSAWPPTYCGLPLDVGAVAFARPSCIEDGRADVQLLRAKEPELSKISADATRLDAAAEAISDPTYLSILRDARSELQAQTSEITDLLENTALAARLAPSMMGADGPRTYFMGFQTNAEARGTGGLLGGFGILRFDNGARNRRHPGGRTTELKGPFAPIDLGPEYAEQYGFTNPSTDLRNSNLSSHFPYAAQIWKSMWAQQTGNERRRSDRDRPRRVELHARCGRARHDAGR